jgi:hypothetical protein
VSARARAESLGWNPRLWADNTHIPLENIQELRNLIPRPVALEPSQPRDARVAVEETVSRRITAKIRVFPADAVPEQKQSARHHPSLTPSAISRDWREHGERACGHGNVNQSFSHNLAVRLATSYRTI